VLPTGKRTGYAGKVALVAGVYFGAAKFGLTLGFENSSITAVWPPTGIALAALLIWGYRVWPGIALGALLANSWTGVPVLAVLGITTGNTLEALTGAYLLLNVAQFRPDLERVKDVVALALAAAISTIVSATVGVASLALAGSVASGELASAWRVWWLGDLGGDLLVATVLLVFAAAIRTKARPERVAESGALLAALVGVALLVLSQRTDLAYLMFPLLVWAALRFGQRGATFASLIVAGIAVFFTSRGMGPFVSGTRDDSLLLSQTFMGLTALTALLLAAVNAERERAREALRSARDGLEQMVGERTDALKRKELQLSEAQRLAHIGSWEWDITADEVTWSDELYRIYGLDAERFGASYEAFLERVHPDDREAAQEAVGNALEDPGPFEYYHRLVRPDGAVRTLHARGDLVVGDDGAPVHMFGTAQDVTERIEADEEADRLKEEFFALVSHELRTPLSSIKGYLELLVEEKGGAHTNERAREFLATIGRNSRQLERLVGDLLFAAQVQHGDFAVEDGSVDLNEVLARSVDTVVPWAEERGMNLTLVADHVGTTGGDEDRLSQLFDNLISNALKYTPDGGRVEVSLRREAGAALIQVRDTGIGISAAERSRIYDRFFRATAATERSIPGAGLGLTIAKAIAEAHGGCIGIESEEGAGTTVSLQLPLERVEAGSDGRKAELVS
jgi:PAS domain S-box-containing protein